MNKHINLPNIFLACILVAAAILRFGFLTMHSMWWDELLCMFIARPGRTYAEIFQLIVDLEHTSHGSYYAILHTWMNVFGHTDAGARSFTAVTGVAGTFNVYLLGRDLAGKRIGLIGALLTAVNYAHLYYSLDVHYYSLLFTLSAISYWCFVRMTGRFQWGHLIGYVFSTWLMIIIHHFTLLVFVSQCVAWLALYRTRIIHEFRNHRHIVLGFALVALAYAPFLTGFFRTMSLKTIDLPELPGYFFVSWFEGYFGYSGIAAMPAALALFFFVITAFIRPGRTDTLPENSVFVLSVWLLFPVTVAALWSVSFSTVMIDRYTIVILPPLLLMIAAGIDQVKRPLHRYAFLALVVAGSAGAFARLDFFTRPAKDDFKGVAQFISDHHKTDGKFFLYSDKNWCFKYYLDQHGTKPEYLEAVDYADGRFYVNELLYKTEWVVIDTTLKDIWIATAHFKNRNAMQSVCDTLMQSGRFTSDESFYSHDAFAKHFVRKY